MGEELNSRSRYMGNEALGNAPAQFQALFAIEFLKCDKDITLLADLIGYSSINTTQIYLRLLQDEQQARLNRAMNFQDVKQ